MTEKKAHPLVIYTDGSSRGNPGPGGYGALLIWGEKVKELWGGYKYTTNNRMELMGVIQALMAVTKKNIPITIYTDSQYIVNSVEKNGSTIGSKPILKAAKKTKTSGLYMLN